MIQVAVGNSDCRVTGLSVTQLSALRELMFYNIKSQEAFFSGHPGGRKRYLLDKRGNFPTGLLYIVEQYLAKVPHEIRDTRVRPKSIPGLLKGTYEFEPYPEQIEAALAAVAHSRGIVAAPTGVGKSVIAALTFENLCLRGLLVVPSLELKKQLTASLRTIFGKDKVGPMVGDLCPNLITVENVDSLVEWLPHPKKKGETICVTKPAHDIDVVVIDEFHHSGARSYLELNRQSWGGVFHKIGLTATPFRSNEDERLLLESVLSKVIYRIEYATAVAKGYIVPMEAYYIDLPKQELSDDCNETRWNSVYSELVVNNEARNKIIAGMLSSLDAAGVPTLCLVKEIAHGDGLALDTGVAFANGKRDDTRTLILEFNLQERTSLIGTTGVLGEGVDTKPAEYVILAAGGKSKGAFMQQCGRGFRRYGNKKCCVVILFRDASHKWTLSHFNACVRYLKEEYGIRPARLDIDNF